jgi:hypothetical protein
MRAYRVDRTRTGHAMGEGTVRDLSSCIDLLDAETREGTAP